MAMVGYIYIYIYMYRTSYVHVHAYGLIGNMCARFCSRCFAACSEHVYCE